MRGQSHRGTNSANGCCRLKVVHFLGPFSLGRHLPVVRAKSVARLPPKSLVTQNVDTPLHGPFEAITSLRRIERVSTPGVAHAA